MALDAKTKKTLKFIPGLSPQAAGPWDPTDKKKWEDEKSKWGEYSDPTKIPFPTSVLDGDSKEEVEGKKSYLAELQTYLGQNGVKDDSHPHRKKIVSQFMTFNKLKPKN